MRVRLSTAAKADVVAIGDLILREAQAATADRFVQRLLDACEALEHIPEAYPIMTAYRRRGYRRKVFGRYLIVFRISGAGVDVVRVLHGARDIARILR